MQVIHIEHNPQNMIETARTNQQLVFDRQEVSWQQTTTILDPSNSSISCCFCIQFHRGFGHLAIILFLLLIGFFILIGNNIATSIDTTFNLQSGLLLAFYLVYVVFLFVILGFLCSARGSPDSVQNRDKYVKACILGIVMTILTIPFSVGGNYVIMKNYQDELRKIGIKYDFWPDFWKVLAGDGIRIVISLFLWSLWLCSAKRELENHKPF